MGLMGEEVARVLDLRLKVPNVDLGDIPAVKSLFVAAFDILANDWNILRVTPINGSVILKTLLKKSAIIEIKKTVVKGAKYEFRTDILCFVI